MTSSCQLTAKECMLSTDKLPLGGLPRNCVVRINDLTDMTTAVYRGHKATNQTKKLFHSCVQRLIKEAKSQSGWCNLLSIVKEEEIRCIFDDIR